jgi:1,2-diacylglycerol 3-alpha-glucosyltransferase
MSRVAIIHNHPIHYKHLLFTSLKEHGLDFEVLFTASSSNMRLRSKLLDSAVYRYRIGYEGQYEKAPALATARYVWESLSELEPNIVILGGYYDVAAWTAWLWSIGHSVPSVLWAESNSFDYPRVWWKELPKRVFVKACAVAHVYGRSNQDYIRQLGMPLERIELKRAVADVARLLSGERPDHEQSDARTILYVGRFAPEKNLEGLIRAFAKVSQSQRPVFLALVGYGELEPALRSLARELGVDSRVQFWGKADPRELPELYRLADAFVLPSVREPWGLVAVEAMCCGLPVIVSDRCGCAADVVTEDTGWVFSPGNEAQLTGLLERVANLPSARLEEMGKAAQSLGATYSSDNCARIVIRSLNQLEVA